MSTAEAVLDRSGLAGALARLDEILAVALERSRAWLGTPGSDPFRGLYLSHDQVARGLTVPAGEPFGTCPAQAETRTGALGRLVGAFDLDPFEADVLVLAVAPEVDLRYERIYAYLQDHVARRRPTVDLALSLLCGSAAERVARRAHFLPDAPLIRHALVEVAVCESPPPPLLSRPVLVDAQIVGVLLGAGGVDHRCGRLARLDWPQASLDELAIDEASRSRLMCGVRRARAQDGTLRLAIHGGDSTARREVAAAVATTLETPLLTVNAGDLSAAGDVWQAVRIVFRERWLRGAVLLVEGTEILAEPKQHESAGAILHHLAQDRGGVVMAGSGSWQIDAGATSEPLGVSTLTLKNPPYGVRRRAWTRRAAARRIALSPEDADALAGRFVLGDAQIAEAVAAASASTESVSREDLFAAAREQSARALRGLAERVMPTNSWEELIVPSEVLLQLRELCATVVYRTRVLDDWGFGRRLSRGKGVTALFAGAAGTGKTLAAEVVAAELGLDLYRIDLSGVVSKYIGETEKNLERIFRAAEDANAVLLFDEADALFGKRSEVRDSHDRYANIEISYLLQKMEAYEGVAILATNLSENLDKSFVRRLAFIVTFPFPEIDERRRIWDVVWPAETPLSDDIDLDALAGEHRLSGGQIKNAALAAAYLAAEGNEEAVSSASVKRALRRELAKVGRDVADRARLTGTGPVTR